MPSAQPAAWSCFVHSGKVSHGPSHPDQATSIAAVCAATVVTSAAVAFASTAPATATPRPSSASTCRLGNGVKHVISIVLDNVHFSRDNPNVPSDLEQMPHLLNFLTSNGTVLSNTHTP